MSTVDLSPLLKREKVEWASRIIFTTDPARTSVEAFIDLSIEQDFIPSCDNRDELFSLDMISKINTETSK